MSDKQTEENFRYPNKLKGRVFQGAIQCLFEQNNYKIVPFGVENTLREITCLSRVDYNNLKLPDTVKYTPDFVILDDDLKGRKFLEVKYRTNFEEELFHCLEKQVGLFGELYTIIFLANPPKSKYSGNRQASTHIRIIHAKPEDTGTQYIDKNGNRLRAQDILKNPFNWYNFQLAQEVFEGFKSTDTTLETTTNLILNLMANPVKKLIST